MRSANTTSALCGPPEIRNHRQYENEVSERPCATAAQHVARDHDVEASKRQVMEEEEKSPFHVLKCEGNGREI